MRSAQIKRSKSRNSIRYGLPCFAFEKSAINSCASRQRSPLRLSSARTYRGLACSSLSDSRRMLTISIRATGRPPRHGQSCARQPNNRAIPRGTREKARSAGHPPADCRLSPGERAVPCNASLFLLSRCGETAPLDRYLKGSGNSFRRVLSFFQNVFPIRRSSAS